MSPRSKAGTWVAIGLLWLTIVAAGMAKLMDYDSSPGAAAAAPGEWPPAAVMTRAANGPTLVMFVHPRCDCTRASLGELAEVLARARQKPRTYVVFIKPQKSGEAWEHSSLWISASKIPGVSVVRDDAGAEAHRFGVRTSGQTLLYDADGRLVFSGGTTAARGKPGNSTGRATLVALIAGETPPASSTPVFGCELFGPGEEPSTQGAHDHDR
jgi:hypothetical protein